MPKSFIIRRGILVSLLLIIVVTVYSPATRHSFIWDDDYYITHNMTLAGLTGLKEIWMKPGATPQYYPLVFTSFWVEYHLFGLNPFVFHTTNILLHAANAVLVWLILSRLRMPWAWLTAALFALHPVNVESVAWISERKNVLSGLFVLSALLLLIRAFGAVPQGKRPWGARTFYLAAFLLFIMALLSKTVTCMMPVVFLLLLWWKASAPLLKKATAAIPFFLAGTAAGLHTAIMEKSHVGAYGAEWDFPFIDRILIAGRALWFYAYKIICPVKLIFIYPRWHIDPAVWWQYLFPLSVLALFITLWILRDRIGRGPLTGAAVFAVTLFPALGFINYYPMRYSFVADHFQYLASIPLIALITAGMHHLFNGNRPRIGTTALVFFSGLLLLMGSLTWQAQKKYENQPILWKDTLSKNPDCWMALNNLGTILAHAGEMEKAVDHYLASISIYPLNMDARRNLERITNRVADLNVSGTPSRKNLYPSDAHQYTYTLVGNMMALIGMDETAIRYFRKATTPSPGHADAWYGMGYLLERQGRFDEAIHHYRHALVADPLYTKALSRLGIVYIELGRYEEAIPQLSTLLKIDPYQAGAYRNLGRAYDSLEDSEKAAGAYAKALILQPYNKPTQNALRSILEGRPARGPLDGKPR